MRKESLDTQSGISTLISDFQSLELWEHECLWCKPPSLWYFIMAALTAWEAPAWFDTKFKEKPENFQTGVCCSPSKDLCGWSHKEEKPQWEVRQWLKTQASWAALTSWELGKGLNSSCLRLLICKMEFATSTSCEGGDENWASWYL